jgi:hypothetical protein
MSPTFRRCEDCGGERPFEQPHETGSCPDSPDGCCPEWSCTECGTALPPVFWPVTAQPSPPPRFAPAPDLLAPVPAMAGQVA